MCIHNELKYGIIKQLRIAIYREGILSANRKPSMHSREEYSKLH